MQDPLHPESSMLVGAITKSNLEADSSCVWFSSRYKDYHPSPLLLQQSLREADVHLVIFAGTWCEDSQVIIPGLFKWLDLAGFSESRISLYGVDRDKKTTGDLAGAFGITNVPTIIVMQAGKERGRVVEYGKTGKWEEELALFLK